MNSGCKGMNERYKPIDSTHADLGRPARNAKSDLETAADNIHELRSRRGILVTP
jgi:hypothetical protein